MHVDLESTFSSGCTRGEKERRDVTNDNYHDPFMHRLRFQLGTLGCPNIYVVCSRLDNFDRSQFQCRGYHTLIIAVIPLNIFDIHSIRIMVVTRLIHPKAVLYMLLTQAESTESI